jgi:cyclopropane fatty-acyl-phospholipid synthase-like methyltransferase
MPALPCDQYLYLAKQLEAYDLMERAEWLKMMRDKAEVVYDQLSPQYWVTLGLHPDDTHREFIQNFLGRMAPGSTLLSAGCGAGRYDGLLLKGGHNVVGIDQSAGMLGRASERLPEVRYEKLALQDMDFREEFDGAICPETLEHICPEDWPGILRRFWAALKPGGVLYFSVDLAETDKLEAACDRARASGLPVVYGEVVDDADAAYEWITSIKMPVVPTQDADEALYHYYPPLDQVRQWLDQAGLVIEAEGTGDGYAHFIVRKRGKL